VTSSSPSLFCAMTTRCEMVASNLWICDCKSLFLTMSTKLRRNAPHNIDRYDPSDPFLVEQAAKGAHGERFPVIEPLHWNKRICAIVVLEC